MPTNVSEKALAEITAKVEGEYLKRTKRSQQIAQEARNYLPGGDTRRSIFFFPYPIWMDHADAVTSSTRTGTTTSTYTTQQPMILGHETRTSKLRQRPLDRDPALGAYS